MKLKQKLLGRVLAVVAVSLFSVSLHAQHKVSFSYENTPLKTILQDITKQTGYTFVYSDAFLKSNSNYSFTMNSDNISINAILEALFRGRSVSFTIEEKQVILVPESISVKKTTARRTENIKGTVTDSEGNPVVGAIVSVKDGKEYTVSDIDGNYEIAASSADVLVVNYVGFKTEEITVNGRSVLDIVLQEDVQLLEDVVVTGYQTISKERSAASYNIVKGEDLKQSAMSRGSILESLEGTAPGLTVNFSEDAESKYSIRGITSINSSKEPLFVLDGVPVSSDDLESLLSANDIASVTVLKDATAVSIWGSRAANGVVVITTKSGNDTKGKIRITYDGNFTLKGKPDIDYYNLMDSRTFIKNATEMFETEEYQETYPWETVTTTLEGLLITGYDRPMVYPHEQILYDWQRGLISLEERDSRLEQLASQDGYQSYQDEIMSSVWTQSHSISVSGGTDKFNIYGSIGYEGSQGNEHDRTDLYKINLKQSYKLAKWLDWDLLLNAVYSESTEYDNTLDLVNFNNPYQGLMPYAVLRNEDGSYVNFKTYYMYEPYIDQVESDLGISMDYYPVEDFWNTKTRTVGTTVRINTGLTAKIWKGLGYEVRFQYLRGASNSEYYIPEDTWYMRHERILATDASGKQYLPSKGGDFTVNDSFNVDWTIRNQLTYDRSFLGDKHQVTALLGTEWRESKTNGYYSFRRGYDYQTMASTSYDITTLQNFLINYYGNYEYINIDKISNSETLLRYVSYYANLAYTFNKRLSLNGSVRIDQSNLFGTGVNSQYKPIGSVGVAWRIGDEPFMSNNVSWVDNLTLRLSYGLSGNSPLPDQGGPYDLISAYTHPMLGDESGYELNTPANNKIGWEKTRTWNFGIDFDLFKNRLSGSIDIYDKLTTDLLANKPLNVLTGFSTIYANVGSLYNRGVELSLNSVNFNKRDFGWNTGLTLSYNDNKVLDYYNDPSTSLYTALSNNYVAGYPACAVFMLRWAGLRHEDGVPQVYDNEGNIQYNYYSLDADDVYFGGSALSNWSGSLTNTLRYKNFSLSAMLIFNLGGVIKVNDHIATSGRFNNNRSADFDNRWRQPGDEAFTDVPVAVASTNSEMSDWNSSGLYSSSDVSYQSRSYAKLRELSLTYSLPKKLCNKMSVGSVKFRVTAHDLFKIVANDRGIDPEAAYMYGGRTANYGSYYSFGLSISF